jgi:hypothetical protein
MGSKHGSREIWAASVLSSNSNFKSWLSINIYMYNTEIPRLGPAQRRTESEKTIGRQDAEEDGHRLPEADRPRDG